MDSRVRAWAKDWKIQDEIKDTRFVQMNKPNQSMQNQQYLLETMQGPHQQFLNLK